MHVAPSLAMLQSGFFVFAILVVLLGIPAMRRMREFTSSAMRLSVYRSGVVSLWTLALGASMFLYPGDLLVLEQTGGAMQGLESSALLVAVAALVCAAYFSLAIIPALHCRLRPLARHNYRAGLENLQFLLPVSSSERRWWILLSISAGICEEIYFRGFMPQFLSGQLHGGWAMAPVGAWLLSSLVFGLCHLYQGAAGILRTAVAGLMFSVLAVLTGNLLLPIVLHVLIDLAVLWMYQPQSDHPEAAALLIRGCTPADAAGSAQTAMPT